jgi:hypothetical protein
MENNVQIMIFWKPIILAPIQSWLFTDALWPASLLFHACGLFWRQDKKYFKPFG